jgi:hypothetical protein
MWAWLLLVLAIVGFFWAPWDSSLVREAKEAEGDGRVISNEMMQEMYPASFRPGNPEYLERDFEAGADFICDEIKKHYGSDLCAEPKIKWRR